MTVEPILKQRMIAHLVKATEEVFATMVFEQVSLGTPIEGDALRPASNVVAQVGFTGATNGLVAFYSTLETAREIAGAMLMMEPAQISDELPDAIGEISNMIAGAFRSQMTSDGYPCAISIPTVTTGSDFYTKPFSAGQRVLCPFRFRTREVFVELIVMAQADAEPR